MLSSGVWVMAGGDGLGGNGLGSDGGFARDRGSEGSEGFVVVCDADLTVRDAGFTIAGRGGCRDCPDPAGIWCRVARLSAAGSCHSTESNCDRRCSCLYMEYTVC